MFKRNRSPSARRPGRRLADPATVAVLLAAMLATGCHHPINTAERAPYGWVYYLDGAGGGLPLANWGRGVGDGLLEAGYDGGGSLFGWNTGLGVLADQTSSNEYKRSKAGELAKKMTEYKKEHPDAPMTLMGLSAGTAVAAFTLEALPQDVYVEDVFLLSGSLSSNHDLTRALRRVNDKMYITTSHRDGVLTVLVPQAGTADRQSGTTATVGVQGPQLPPGASPETRRLYHEKIVMMPWKADFAQGGDSGGHLGTVQAGFVAQYIAPLVKSNTGREFAANKESAPRGMVENPTYKRWAGFAVGSWLQGEGTQTIDGQRQRVLVKATLEKKTPRSMLIRREVTPLDGQEEETGLPAVVFANAFIKPETEPGTHPDSRFKELPSVTHSVAGRDLTCRVRAISTRGDFSAWGHNPQAEVHLNEAIPGHIAALKLKTEVDGRKIEYDLKIVEFHAIPAK